MPAAPETARQRGVMQRRSPATGTRALASLLALGLAAAPLAPRAWAHGDHGAAPPGVTIIAPRTEARAGTMELVAVFSHQTLAIFLSRYADGAPVTGAKVSVASDLQSADLQESDSGLYVTQDILLSPGHNDLTVTLTLGAVTRTQSIGLTTPVEHVPAAAKPPSALLTLPLPARSLTLIGLAAAGLLLASATALLWRRTRRARPLGAGLQWQGPV